MANFRSTHAGADSAANNYQRQRRLNLGCGAVILAATHMWEIRLDSSYSEIHLTRKTIPIRMALVRVIWESESRARAAQRCAFGEAKNQVRCNCPGPKCGAPFGPSPVKGNAFLRTRGSCSRKSHCTRTQCHVKQLVFTCAHCYKDAAHRLPKAEEPEM
jgi:hypothetical protein